MYGTEMTLEVAEELIGEIIIVKVQQSKLDLKRWGPIKEVCGEVVDIHEDELGRFWILFSHGGAVRIDGILEWWDLYQKTRWYII